MALGAGAVSIGQGVLIALGCNGDGWVNESSVHIAAEEDCLALDTAPGYCNHWPCWQYPVGITTQDIVLERHLISKVAPRG
ncbi:hypothetical protein [Acidithiobacillus ferrianus]|uniref:hypothetical protein n=1 Tax=Acidithiobacillus ferrianus TaxID=2678518 RepID=UPI003B82F272